MPSKPGGGIDPTFLFLADTHISYIHGLIDSNGTMQGGIRPHQLLNLSGCLSFGLGSAWCLLELNPVTNRLTGGELMGDCLMFIFMP